MFGVLMLQRIFETENYAENWFVWQLWINAKVNSCVDQHDCRQALYSDHSSKVLESLKLSGKPSQYYIRPLRSLSLAARDLSSFPSQCDYLPAQIGAVPDG